MSSIVYLNNAASSWPKAPGVAEAVRLTMDEPPYHPGRSGAPARNVLEDCRQLLATMLGVSDPSRIVLTSGATHSLNLAILGLELRPGAHVVTTLTEHNSVLRPLSHLAQRSDIHVTHIGLDSQGNLDTEHFGRAIDEQPALVVMNHASNVTGRINDVGPLFAKAKAAGAVTLLDAAQSFGHIPVMPNVLQADMVAFTGHKGLRGPAGTGGLYVSPEIDLEQFIVGGTGVRSELVLHPHDMPMRLEAGTPNVPAFAGLAAALTWHLDRGPIHNATEARLARSLRAQLSDSPGVRLFDDDESSPHTGVVSFGLEGWSVEEAGFVLSESFGIVCRTGLHCAPLIHECIGSAPEGSIRFSISGSNTDEDVERAVTAVRRLAA